MGTVTGSARTGLANRPPRLENGDRLTRDEFERRYLAMPDLKKAELIEGVVHLPSPVRIDQHGEPSGWLVAWLANYAAHHPDTQFGDNVTVRLDLDNEVQPDALLRRRDGGTSRVEDGYVVGAPELIVEVAASSVSIDLHAKKNVYRRNGVREYIAWRVLDGALDWFVLAGGDYVLREPGTGDTIESVQFPGLRLDTAALVAGDYAKAIGAR